LLPYRFEAPATLTIRVESKQLGAPSKTQAAKPEAGETTGRPRLIEPCRVLSIAEFSQDCLKG